MVYCLNLLGAKYIEAGTVFGKRHIEQGINAADCADGSVSKAGVYPLAEAESLDSFYYYC
jgi:hypothetical protein